MYFVITVLSHTVYTILISPNLDQEGKQRTDHQKKDGEKKLWT